LGESIAQVLPAKEVPLITAAVSQTSNTAEAVGASNPSSPSVAGTVVALKPEGFVDADIDSEYGEMMVVDDLEEDMDLLEMADYFAELDDPNSMLAASMETGEEVLGGDDGITGLLFGEDFEMMIRYMPKEDPYITEKAVLAQSIDITEEYMAYHGYRSKPMQRQESRRPSQRAGTVLQKPTYPNIRDYLKNRAN
jgi:hypothetical protein|tara:strand:+ start:649 stop:1233 length:585 start_codon:yes stop_codon:yes gene_type:complete